jgi:negative regulator of sigma E activity
LSLPGALLAAVALASAAPTAPPPSAVLRESVFASKNVSYVGQVETVRFSSKKATATLVRVEHRAPDLTRRSFLAPELLYGDYVVLHGDASYYFDVKHARVFTERDAVPDDTSLVAGDLDRILSNYRAMAGGSALVAGRQAEVITLVNKYTGERTVRLWIDEQTHLILRREEYRSNGAVAMTSRFEELRYTGNLPEALFSTRRPAGFSSVPGLVAASFSQDLAAQAKAAGFAPITPKDLPQGFELIGSQAAVVNDVKTLHLTYSDGLRSLSLFENARGAAVDFGAMHPQTVRFEGIDSQYLEEGSTSLLSWREHRLYFTLVGDLSRNELVAIAKSVVP